MKSSTECKCNKKMEKVKVSKYVHLAGQEIFVKDAPALRCPDCNEIYINGVFLLEKERELLNKKVVA